MSGRRQQNQYPREAIKLPETRTLKSTADQAFRLPPHTHQS